MAAGRPEALPGQPLAVGGALHREADVGVEPFLRPAHVLGVDREPRREHLARRLGRQPQPVELGPRSLRIHMVGRDGGDAAPVVDAGRDERPQVRSQVGRRLEVDRRVQEQPGHGRRPEHLLLRAGWESSHARPRLGQEVLDDDLLHVAVTAVRGLDGQQCLDAFLPGLPEPDEEAGGERDPGLAGRLQRGEAALRRLVRCLVVRPALVVEAGGERLQHHPLGGRDGPQALEFSPGEGAGVGVGE